MCVENNLTHILNLKSTATAATRLLLCSSTSNFSTFKIGNPANNIDYFLYAQCNLRPVAKHTGEQGI